LRNRKKARLPRAAPRERHNAWKRVAGMGVVLRNGRAGFRVAFGPQRGIEILNKTNNLDSGGALLAAPPQPFAGKRSFEKEVEKKTKNFTYTQRGSHRIHWGGELAE